MRRKQSWNGKAPKPRRNQRDDEENSLGPDKCHGMVWLKKMSPSSNATESVCESLWLKRAKNKIKKRGR